MFRKTGWSVAVVLLAAACGEKADEPERGEGGTGGVGGTGGSLNVGTGATGGTGNTGNVGNGNTGNVGTGAGAQVEFSCEETWTASDEEPLIDDFEHGNSPELPDLGQRSATWSRRGTDDAAVRPIEFPTEGDGGLGGAGNTFARIRCEDGSLGSDAHCNQGYDYIAAASFLATFDGADSTSICYDATAHEGVRFRARSREDGVTLFFVTEQYSTPLDRFAPCFSTEFTLGTDWEEFEVPFDTLSRTAFEQTLDPVTCDPAQILGFGFIVPAHAVGDFGYYLDPYQVDWDDVEFY